MQYDLRLIQFRLYGRHPRQLPVDRIGPKRLQLRPVECARRLLLDLRGRESALEIVDDLGEHGLPSELVVPGLRYEDGGEAEGCAVGVDVECMFFDPVSGAGACSFGDCFGGEDQAFFVTVVECD